MPPRNGLMFPVSERIPSGKIRIDQPSPVSSPMYCSVCRAPGLALRQRERVEVERRQVVEQRGLEPLAPGVLLRKEVRLEELLLHRRRRARAPAPGQRRQDHRHVHVALMIGGEDDRTIDGPQMLAPRDVQVREHARERQNPGRQRQAAYERHDRSAVPRRERDRLLGGLRRPRAASRAAFRSPTLAASANCASSMRVWNRSSSATISSTRSSELSPSSSIVVVPLTSRPRAKRAMSASTESPPSARDRRRAGLHEVRGSGCRFSLRVPSVRGSSDPGQADAVRMR